MKNYSLEKFTYLNESKLSKLKPSAIMNFDEIRSFFNELWFINYAASPTKLYRGFFQKLTFRRIG